MATVADWWDSLSVAQREVAATKRGMKAEIGQCRWAQLNQFTKEILNDPWWWGYAQELRGTLTDGPLEEEDEDHSAAIAQEDIRGLLSGIIMALESGTLEQTRAWLYQTLEESHDGKPVSIDDPIDQRDEIVSEFCSARQEGPKALSEFLQKPRKRDE